MKNNFENLENMQRMQQEAVRRVREMQKRAKQSLVANSNYNNSNEELVSGNKTTQNPDITEQINISESLQSKNNNPEETKNTKKLHKNNDNFEVFSKLFDDHEKILILLLILLLVDEGCDLSLVVALMYLII